MKIKTAYRTNSPARFPAEKIAEEIPPSEKIDINSEPAADAVVVHHESNEPIAEAVAEAVKADEATDRLRKQLDDIRRSEEIQRQQATHAAMQPTPEQVLQFWKNNGLGESAERYLVTNPQHILGLTDFASRQAIQQGHQPGSAAHTEAAKTIFHDNLARLEAQQAQAAPTPQPTPEFFRPSPPLPPELPERNSHYSAPPSRSEVGSYRAEPSPQSVRLSEAEKQIADISGISHVDYARGKLRLARETASGERQR